MNRHLDVAVAERQYRDRFGGGARYCLHCEANRPRLTKCPFGCDASVCSSSCKHFPCPPMEARGAHD